MQKQIVRQTMIVTLYDKNHNVLSDKQFKGKYYYREPLTDNTQITNAGDENFPKVLGATCDSVYETMFRHRRYRRLDMWCQWIAEKEIAQIEVITKDKIIDKNSVSFHWCQENLNLKDFAALCKDEGIDVKCQ